MFNVLFSFRGYEVTFLELIASLASFIGVGLGITGKRITWPWWAISSTLYAILFWKWDLYASAALQFIFIAAAAMGWFGWEVSGAKPGPFANKYRVLTFIAIVVATFALFPLMKHFGAAAALPDTFLFFGSFAAQLLMVYEKYDNWPVWLIVDAGYTILQTELLTFTRLL